MKRICGIIALSLVLALTAFNVSAEPPPRPSDWGAVTPIFDCSIDTLPGVQGECRVFIDSTGLMWTVFWDSPGEIKFIRSFTQAPYEYIYERTVEPVGIDT